MRSSARLPPANADWSPRNDSGASKYQIPPVAVDSLEVCPGITAGAHDLCFGGRGISEELPAAVLFVLEVRTRGLIGRHFDVLTTGALRSVVVVRLHRMERDVERQGITLNFVADFVGKFSLDTDTRARSHTGVAAGRGRRLLPRDGVNAVAVQGCAGFERGEESRERHARDDFAPTLERCHVRFAVGSVDENAVVEFTGAVGVDTLCSDFGIILSVFGVFRPSVHSQRSAALVFSSKQN
jgi:hypothetical protein